MDYIATYGVQAFDDLEAVIDELVETGVADEIWQKKTKEQLKQAKRYLKIDYKTHVAPQDVNVKIITFHTH